MRKEQESTEQLMCVCPILDTNARIPCGVNMISSGVGAQCRLRMESLSVPSLWELTTIRIDVFLSLPLCFEPFSNTQSSFCLPHHLPNLPQIPFSPGRTPKNPTAMGLLPHFLCLSLCSPCRTRVTTTLLPSITCWWRG